MGQSTSVGDEGGFAPNIASPEDTLSLLTKAVENSGYKVQEDIVFALDVAATEFYKDGLYNLTNFFPLKNFSLLSLNFLKIFTL